MKPALVVTDLDGTLLEPDGRCRPEVLQALRKLKEAGVPVVPVTSKTAPEVRELLLVLGLSGPAGLENGAALVRGDGTTELSPGAIPYPQLLEVASDLRTRSGVRLRTLPELSDSELHALTGLPREKLGAVRIRAATCPLVVDPRADVALAPFLPEGTRLVRGNRFLHLQGCHTKASVLPAIRQALGVFLGPVLAFGDAPNDLELLAAADLKVIVPSEEGPNRELIAAFPEASVAPLPHGRGWAKAIAALILEAQP